MRPRSAASQPLNGFFVLHRDYLTPLSELGGVPYEVEEGLAQAAGVASDRPRDFRSNGIGEFDAFLSGRAVSIAKLGYAPRLSSQPYWTFK